MSLDKLSDARRIWHWMGHMETDYVYTLGVAGERFFKEIMQNEKITGAKCKCCNIVYVPPRMYCEKCFSKLEEWVDVGKKGIVHTFTIACIDKEGNCLKEPVIYAVIKFNGVEGGLVHKLGEVKPENVCIGMKVEAVFKPREQRVGSINDIKYFKPTA